jgi:hypothetical protein
MSGLASQWKPSTASGRSAFNPRRRLDTSTASLESEADSTTWATVAVASSVVGALQPPLIAPAPSTSAPSHRLPLFLFVMDASSLLGCCQLRPRP